jgi:hypothetical protein
MASFSPNGLEDIFFDTIERAESRGLAPPSAAVPVPAPRTGTGDKKKGAIPHPRRIDGCSKSFRE